jgi:hypothetical protein
MAATAPPTPSTSTGARDLLTPTFDDVTVAGGEASGEFGRFVTVRFSGATPHSGYQVFNDTSGNSIEDFREVSANGTSFFQIPIEPGVTNDIRVVLRDAADYDHPLTVPVVADDTRDDFGAPTVTRSQQHERDVLRVKVAEQDGFQSVLLRDAQQHIVAVQEVVDGRAQFVLPRTTHETVYDVQQYNRSFWSESTRVVVNDGAGSAMPAAPAVSAAVSNGHVMATAEGEKGATVTLRDPSGKQIAVRVLNAAGVASIVLPASVEGEMITATQARGQLVSAPVEIPVPTR